MITRSGARASNHGERELKRGKSSNHGEREMKRGKSSNHGEREMERGKFSNHGEKEMEHGKSSNHGEKEMEHGKSSNQGEKEMKHGKSSNHGEKEMKHGKSSNHGEKEMKRCKASDEEEKEIKRGLTVMREVDRAKRNNIKFDVGWNSKGQPINPNKSKFVSYIGVVTRRTVPIRYDSWRSVAEEYKNKVWEDVVSAFNVDESRRKFVLRVAGRLLRSFRAYLTRDSLKDVDGNINMHPPKIYTNIISEDDWKAFVASRVGDSFQLEQAGPQVKSIPRHVLWKAGHVNKEGHMDEAVQKKALLQSGLQKNKQNSGHGDILAKALNAREHPGRVRGLGFGVSQRNHFPLGKCSKLRAAQNEWKSVRERLDALRRDAVTLCNQMKIPKDKEVEKQVDLARSSSGGSCSLASTDLPEVPAQSEGKSNEREDIGQPEELFTAPIENQPKSALVPFRVDGANNQLDRLPPNNPLDRLPPNNPLDRLPPSCKLLDRYVRKFLTGGDQLTIDMEKDIFNCEYQEMIGQEQISEILHQKQIGASVVSIYIRYLYHTLLVPKQMSKRFSFLCPHKLALPSANKIEYQYEHFKKSEYISGVLISNEKRKKVFFAPFNTGEHWVLIVIDADAKNVYYLDPMGGDLENYSEMKRLINFAVIIYHSGDHNIKWIKLKCPSSKDSKNSGYSVLRFMREIISQNKSTVPETHLSDPRCNFYSQDQIDEIREEWSSYVFDSCT